MIGHRRFVLAGALSAIVTAATAEPETVFFPSADGRTEIVGYLFKPAAAGPHGAVVLLHGRGGPYSINDNADCTLVSRSVTSACNAGTLSMRHRMWGEYWAAHGYLALLPDSFGPRSKAHGFGRFTHDDPERDDVNEKTVRPLDAEGASPFCEPRRRHRQPDLPAGLVERRQHDLERDVSAGRAGPRLSRRARLYPGCGHQRAAFAGLDHGFPMTMFLGSDDEEVSPAICHHVLDAAAAGSPIDVTLYPGATHDFDDPGQKRQSVPGNQSAKQDAMARAIAMVEGLRE